MAAALAINGENFTPFTQVLFAKELGLGPSEDWR